MPKGRKMTPLLIQDVYFVVDWVCDSLRMGIFLNLVFYSYSP